jgi:hypothetical protein
LHHKSPDATSNPITRCLSPGEFGAQAASWLDDFALRVRVADPDRGRHPLYARDRIQAGAVARPILKGRPLAVVVTTPELHDYVRRYINLTAAERPVKIVKTVEQAKAWLLTQGAAV